MTQPAKSQEPSMEEILASIRRIIADDDASKTTQREVDVPNAASQPIEPPPEPSPPEPQAAAPESRVADMLAEAPMAASVDAEGAADQASDILDLTESMAAPTPSEAVPIASDPAPQFRKIEEHSDLSFDEAMEEPAVQSTIEDASSQYLREVAEHHDDRRGQLLSRATSAAVDSAFNSLAQTVLVQNARTLEDLVREMLRPMLKGWLDDNLPAMVERLVRAEIERVSRGRMG